ncbi:MAG TPA: hypothetical protein VF406_04125 [Thermodesulfobacteriota bacterium]
MERFVVLDPTVEADPLPASGPAPRPRALAGRRVGLLDNTKRNADAALDLVAEFLVEKEPSITVVRLRKPTSARPLPPEMVEEARRRCDVVIAGVGD